MGAPVNNQIQQFFISGKNSTSNLFYCLLNSLYFPNFSGIFFRLKYEWRRRVVPRRSHGAWFQIFGHESNVKSVSCGRLRGHCREKDTHNGDVNMSVHCYLTTYCQLASSRSHWLIYIPTSAQHLTISRII